MKRKELNHHYFNEARKSYKELYERSKSGLNFKNLKKLILRKDNFIVALRELSYNAGRETPGLNGRTFSDIRYSYQYEEVLERMGQISPQPSILRYIPKKLGGKRPIGIGNIEDGLIQQMIYNVLEPICEGKFLDTSFGYRREVSS